MRTLSSALQSALSAPVQRPAWLVELNLSTTLLYSSYGTLNWNFNTWVGVDIDVSGLRVGALQVSGSLVFGNADNVFSELFLAQNPTDKRIRIWGYDAAATALGDVVHLVDAVGGGASPIGTREVSVSLRDACEYKLGPRAIVSPTWGFTTLLPAGRKVVINGVSYTLERS